MANCIYCGEPVGFLSRQHKSCCERHDQAAAKIPEFFVKAHRSSIEPTRFRTMIEQVSRNNFVTDTELRQLEVNGLQKLINFSLDNQVPTEKEEQRITELCNTFQIAANELGEPGIRLEKSKILRRLDEGKFPEKVHVDGLPIDFEPNETAIWLFNNASCYSVRNPKQDVSGLPIQFIKGIYYQCRADRAAIKAEHLVENGQGIFLLTSRNACFWSPQKVIKLSIKEIGYLFPHLDGIQIMLDAANAVPQLFKLDDPLFACDAIARLYLLAAVPPKSDQVF